MLELVLILFTRNKWMVMTKMFLNIMTMIIMRNIKWEKSNKLTSKIVLLQRHYRNQKLWCQSVKNWQKIIQRHWHLQHWVYHKEENWWLPKYL